MQLPLEREASNHRNGYNRNQGLAESGAMPLAAPRDRPRRCGLQRIGKHVRVLPGFDQTVLALDQRGLSMRQVQAGVRELYSMEVTAELVSNSAQLAIGVRCDGRREVLDLWLQGIEGALLDGCAE